MAVIESSGLTIDGTNWRKFTNCDGLSEPESFPPGKGESITQAKIICVGCVAARQCLEFAKTQEGRVGIQNVMSDEEIDALFEQRRLTEEASLNAND
ncbi:WhiB family transcriptional regulator [Candidatus Nomurabacteria bacterium]|nr:WhiB family transcriptional regulator [Candidatus Nomurabacteria bacterium]